MSFHLNILDGTSWLAEPQAIRRAVLRLSKMTACPTAREIAAFRQERLAQAKQAAASAPVAPGGKKTGVIFMHGPISQRADAETMKLGGTSTEETSAALDVLMADNSVANIVLHVDSPGGGTYGVEELSDKIYQARGQGKKIWAIADSMACSAAFWIASAADTFAVTPGGDVGSVGVYCVHIDESKALEEDGLKVTMVHAGKFKGEFNNFMPLSEDSRAHLQAQVDATYAKFTDALARNRGVSLKRVQEAFGQGRTLNANEALTAKAVDRIQTFDALMAKLLGNKQGTDRMRTEMLQLRQAEFRRRKVMLEWLPAALPVGK